MNSMDIKNGLNKNPVFVLSGISHVSNFGCEAIIRSVTCILKCCYPGCQIIYVSRKAFDDKKILNDLPVEIIQLNSKRKICYRIFNKIMYFLNIRYRISYDDYKNIFRNITALISVGGDIFTLEKDFNGIKKKSNNPEIDIERYAKKQGAKLILFGASVGPFPRKQGNERYYLEHMRRMDLILAREMITLEYLKESGIGRNTVWAPDPAFFLRQGYKFQKREGIAINLSSRILNKRGKIERQLKEIASLIVKIQESTSEKIYMIPHVYSDYTDDDDRAFLTKVYSFVPDSKKEKITIHEEKRGFLYVKKFLSQRKIVIAARMHCAINAMTESIPTILISYSAKAAGMSEIVYGSKEWCIKSDKLNDMLLEKTMTMYKKNGEIQEKLIERMDELCGEEQIELIGKQLMSVIGVY